MDKLSEDLEFILNINKESPSEHINALVQMVSDNADYRTIFGYGMKYLPKIKDKETGKIDLEKLTGFVPQVVEYFHVVSEIPSLPKTLKDLALDFAAYADGESVQNDRFYFNFDPELELETAISKLG